MSMGLTGYLRATVTCFIRVSSFGTEVLSTNNYVHHLSCENFLCHLSCGNYL